VASSEAYPENVQEILAEYGDTLIKNPMTGEVAPLNEAINRCVTDGENHLILMLANLSLEDAGVVLSDLAPQE
jgi:hypothetical protein